MVWCPIHLKYIRGKKSKEEHANDSYSPCRWMQNYILNMRNKNELR